MYVYILFSLTKAIPIMFKRVTTHQQTLQTWLGHNATRYRKFSLSLAWLGAICNGLPRITVKILKIYISKFFKKTVANIPLQANLIENTVTSSSYGNMLHVVLSIIVGFEKLPYLSVISISVRFHKLSTCFFRIY